MLSLTFPFRSVLLLSAIASTCLGQTSQPSASGANDQRIEISVGGRQIILPPPAGLVRCDGLNAEFDKATLAVLPPTNRLQASFGTPADRKALMAGTAADYSTNANVQVIRSIENKEIGEKSFAQVRQEIKGSLEEFSKTIQKEMEKLVAEGNKRITKESGNDIALSISDTAFLGFFEETDTSLGFTMAMKVGGRDAPAAEAKEQKAVAAALMTPVNGRLLTLYFTAPYSGEQDKLNAEKAVKAWRDDVVAANPRLAGPDMKTSREERLGQLVGILIGCSIAWFVLKSRKKKSAAQPQV